MATIELQSEGKWRISQMYKGKRYRVTIESPEKPKKKVAELAINEVIQNALKNGEQQPKSQKLTIQNACDRYIAAKENSLSPSTIRGYKVYTRNLPEYFSSMNIDEVTEEQLQQLTKWLQNENSIKYTKNVMSFLKSVLKMFRRGFTFDVTFAVDVREEAYIPSQEELKKIIDAARGTQYEIPIMLGAVCGLRRGEILALNIDDLDENNILHINKAVVIDDAGNVIVKNCPKTKGSIRSVFVPQELADKIRTQGYVYEGGAGCINNWLRRTEEKLNIKKFTFHKLRHYFCTTLHENGIPEADIMKLGGWSDPSVMKRIYRHGKNDMEAMTSAAAITANGLF